MFDPLRDSQIYILAIAVTRLNSSAIRADTPLAAAGNPIHLDVTRLNSSAIRADTQKSHFFAAYPIQKTQR